MRARDTRWLGGIMTMWDGVDTFSCPSRLEPIIPWRTKAPPRVVLVVVAPTTLILTSLLIYVHNLPHLLPPRVKVNFRVVELAMQEASMTGGGQRFAPGSGRGAGRRRGVNGEEHKEDKVFKQQLVSAARGFIRAIMLGRKKWSALVQQVCVCCVPCMCVCVCRSADGSPERWC